MKYKYLILFICSSLLILWFFSWEKKPETITLKTFSFNQLPGFHEQGLKKSFEAFHLSCKDFVNRNPDESAGSEYIPMQVKDWLPACKAALAIKSISDKKAKIFFEKWFKPLVFQSSKPLQGLFTGYYLPLIHGSLKKSEKYSVPLYGRPSNLVTINLGLFNPALNYQYLFGRVENSRLLPFYTREEINKGAIAKSAPVLAWVDSHVDRLFLEIQGSGMVELEDGSHLNLGYAGENGAPYTAIGRVLVEKGSLTKEHSSMQDIKAYLTAHPDEILPVINQNKSFVFFKHLDKSPALGTEGVVLTAGYSLAVDRKWIPLGTPLWLDTTRPTASSHTAKNLQRLMIAQDTGGAIRGIVRGDVFWGDGEKATYIAGNMKNVGHYWLLLPKHIVKNLVDNFSYSVKKSTSP